LRTVNPLQLEQLLSDYGGTPALDGLLLPNMAYVMQRHCPSV
jgi:hypothetical protein